MDERIRELARQSELAELYDRYESYCMKNADNDILDFDKVVGKFAELIVKECATFLKEWQVEDPAYLKNEWDKGADWAYGEAGALIKKHLGVE